MSIEHLLDNYSTAGDIATFILCIVILIAIKNVLFSSNDEKFFYLKKSLHVIMLGSITNVIFSLVVKYYGQNDLLIMILRSVYHFMFMCCMYMFILYLKEMLDIKGRQVVVFTYITRLIFAAFLILDVLSPLTKLGFYKEGDLWYDPIVSPYNGFYVYGVLLLLVMLIVYSNRQIRSIRFCLIATEVIIFVIMAQGAIANNNTLTSFTYILPVVMMMILLHSRPFDDRTGALKADSFDSYINQMVEQGKNFDFMVLQLNINGEKSIPKELGKILNSFWHEDFKDAELFRLEDALFVLVISKNAKNGDTREKIQSLMNNEFPKYYATFQLKYKVLGLCDIDFIQSESDIKNIINYLLLTMDDNKMLIVDEKMKDQLKLLHDIIENLIDIDEKCDLNDSRVIAYCQPIKNIQTGKFDTAEALMRMELPEIGFIMPYLFIPIAEEKGYIHSLTKIMLNKVCKQINELESEGYAFERISVNFAASEIRSENFCQEVLNIVKENNVNPSKIGIEITETQNEGDFEIVKKKMKVLKEAGMTLYLDDVGTGYSNIDRIVRYDVDVVKFDRFLLLEAEKDKKVEKLMKHLAEAFEELDYSLLYEGVENEENEALCMSCGADYIQGFKYSKPIPIEEMRNFFSKK